MLEKAHFFRLEKQLSRFHLIRRKTFLRAITCRCCFLLKISCNFMGLVKETWKQGEAVCQHIIFMFTCKLEILKSLLAIKT